MESVVVIVAAYLWGSVPSAYLVGRYLRGIDIRDHGSGNLGASNIMEQVGLRTGLLLGVFDSLGKGTVPVVLALALDQSLLVQAATGVAAIAGHNWSVYIRFTGGRGLATFLGVALGLLLWIELLAWLALIAFGHYITRETALWSLIAMLLVPALALILGEPAEIVYMLVAIAAVLALKRITANWERPRTERYSLPRVMGHRLLWDRDVSRKEQWTARHPRSEHEG